MTRECAWCKQCLGHTAPFDNPLVTHGICAACSEKLLRELRANPSAEGAVRDVARALPYPNGQRLET